MAAPASRVAIRAARLHDVEALSQTRVASWRHAYRELLPTAELERVDHASSRARFSTWLRSRDEQRAILIAETEHEVFGYVQLGPQRNADWNHRGEVFELYLHPDHHGCGVGRMLLAVAVRRLLAMDMGPVLVWVLATNRARAFYERCGGRLVGRQVLDLATTQICRLGYEWTQDLRVPLARGSSIRSR